MHKELAAGLILRSLSEDITSDRARLPDFYAEINGEGDPPQVQEGLRIWTRDLMDGHPTVTPDDIFVVVDPARNDKIASATLLIPQTWRYAGIPFSVGRPELVGTHPDYRGRGLVRELFAVVHARSAELGHSVQAITGIPYFYRQFGYTMTIDLDNHAYFNLAVQDDAPDRTPEFTLRAATVDDIPAMLGWLDDAGRGRLVTDQFSPAMMLHQIEWGAPGQYGRTVPLVIVDAPGSDVGFVALVDLLANPHELRCAIYAVGEKSSYLATFPDVMRAIKAWAVATYGACPELLAFPPGIHATLDTLIDRSHAGLIRRREYAWYLRVPDAVTFLKQIAPVLEQRLTGSGANRYTGELRINFYGLKGVGLRFETGRLLDVTTLSGKDGYDAHFPWHLFWNVVFGYRTVDELGAQFPDAIANQKAAALLEILFPKQKSYVLGLA